MTTLAELLRGRPTIQQYVIMERADRMFHVGRYYGGPLTAEQIKILTEGM
jgi:hypothetical protein